MKHNLNRIGYILFLNLSIIFFILTLLNLLNILDLSLLISNNTLASFLIISLTATIFCKYNLDEYYHRYSSFARSIVDSAQYFFLSLLIILAINQFLKLEFITSRNLLLTISSIGFGFLTFYKNRDRVERELEEEKQKEEDEEKQRHHDFEYKFPRLNRIWGLKHIVRWMYKEGWIYSVGLILIVFLSSMLSLFLINKIPFHIDEAYTYLSANNILKNHEFFGKTITGMSYKGHIVYSWFESIFFKIFNKIAYQLRSLNIIFKMILINLIYFLLKKLSDSKGIALFGTFIFSINWYFILLFEIARQYILAMILLTISIFLAIKVFESKDKNEFLRYSLLFIFIVSLNVLIGHIIGLFCSIILYLLIVTILLKRSKFIKQIFTIFLLSGLLLIYYIFFYDYTIFKWILRNLTFEFSSNLLNTVSLFFYPLNIGLVILIVMTLLFISGANKNQFLRILGAWFIILCALLGYIFGKNIFDMRYLYPISLLLFIIFSTSLMFIKKNKYGLLFTIILIFSLVGNGYCIYQLSKGDLSWSPEATIPWNEFFSKIPQNSTILIEYPLVAELFNFSNVYKIQYNPENDPEAVFSDGSFKSKKYEYSLEEIENFRDYTKNKSLKYISSSPQSYDLYTGYPIVMNELHLAEIINHEENVYALLTYDSYKSRPVNELLYNLTSSGIIVAQHYPEKNNFNDQKSRLNNYPMLTLIKIN